MIIVCQEKLEVGRVYSKGKGLTTSEGKKIYNHPVLVMRESCKQEWLDDLTAKGAQPSSEMIAGVSGLFFYEISTD